MTKGLLQDREVLPKGLSRRQRAVNRQPDSRSENPKYLLIHTYRPADLSTLEIFTSTIYPRDFWNHHVFLQNVRTFFEVSTSIKSIDTLFLLHGMSFDEKHSRKWPQNEIRAHEVASNFNSKSLASSKCRRPSAERLFRTPHYSSR